MPTTFDRNPSRLDDLPEGQPPDHYQRLGLRRFEDNPSVIENAADDRIAFLQTFLGGEQASTVQRLLEEVQVAKRTLLDPQQKAAYDHHLRSVQPDQEGEPAAAGAGEELGVESEPDLRPHASPAVVMWLVLAIAGVVFLLMLFGLMR